MRREDCRYTPFYCEENIWHLCREVTGRDRRVVFISNAAREVLMFRQRGFRDVAAWDYHVILLVDGLVYDLDSTLPFPCSLTDYVKGSFLPETPARLAPRFRLVEADEFVAVFASDRRHMRDAAGNFVQPPPPWPAINETRGSNLMQFVDMSVDFIGRITDLEGLMAEIR